MGKDREEEGYSKLVTRYRAFQAMFRFLEAATHYCDDNLCFNIPVSTYLKIDPGLTSGSRKSISQQVAWSTGPEASRRRRYLAQPGPVRMLTHLAEIQTNLYSNKNFFLNLSMANNVNNKQDVILEKSYRETKHRYLLLLRLNET